MDLAAEDEVAEVLGDVGEGVVGVDEAPGFERGAVVVVGVGGAWGAGVGGGGEKGRVDPGAVAAVEVLFCRGELVGALYKRGRDKERGAKGVGGGEDERFTQYW